MRKLASILFVLLPLVFQSCSNDEVIFPNFDHSAVYFAYQYPIRTVTFGEDFVNTTMDNQGRVQIMATLGGVYSNDKSIYLDYIVDTTLVAGFRFLDDRPIRTMPSHYFQLESNRMVIPSGRIVGGVVVQLTPAFFADPLAISTNYVIPIRLLNVDGADSILQGRPLAGVANPRRLAPGDWEVLPRDFILYAVRYVNPWHGYYLRRGRDVVNGTDTIIRRTPNVERDEVIMASTVSMTEVDLPLVFRNAAGTNVPAPIRLTFDNENRIVISAPPGATYTATGNGTFINDGERNSWGNRDRDVIHLQYQISLPAMEIVANDTLVIRNRGVGMELFEVEPIP